MKIKYFLTFSFIVLSFYFTDKTMIFINNKSPIMKEIVLRKDDYRTEYVNAIIDENTIIPGLNGKEVDELKSFNKMDDLGYFNDLYLVYNESVPLVSINDNKDKIIVKGNPKKNMVSFIVDHNSDVNNYLNQNNIKYTNLVRLGDDLNKNNEYINGEGDTKLFSDLNTLLNRKKINSKICLYNYSDINYCKKKNYYIVQYSINMNDDILSNINKLGSGDIVYISSKTTLNQLKLIINEITRLDLKIDYLSVLISEKN